jgi:hypothetical protein
MSLDDIIKQTGQNRKRQRVPNQSLHEGHGKAPRQHGQFGSRGGFGGGRGRGGRGYNSFQSGYNSYQAQGSYQGGGTQQSFQPQPPPPQPPRQQRFVVDAHNQPQDRFEYRQFQSCFKDGAGNVVFKYRKTSLVTVRPTGDIVLNASDPDNPDMFYSGRTTLQSFNDALNFLGVTIKEKGTGEAGDWVVLDGKSLIRYFDGMVLQAKGPQFAARGQLLLDAINNRSQSTQATMASTAAAVRAGVLPPAALNGSSAGPVRMPMPGFSNGVQDDALRRAAAKGRYMPY